MGHGDSPPAEGSSTTTENPAHKAEEVKKPKNESPFLVMFRAESLLSWGEYVRVNRAFDEDDDPDAGEAYTPSSAVGGHSGGSERASMLVNAIRWFRNG